jgi:hypothetical protein
LDPRGAQTGRAVIMAAEQADYWPQVITGVFTLAAGVGVAVVAATRERTNREEDRDARSAEREADRHERMVDFTLSTVGAAISLIFEIQTAIRHDTPTLDVVEARLRAVRTDLVRLHASHPDLELTRMLNEFEGHLSTAVFSLTAARTYRDESAVSGAEAALRDASALSDELVEKVRTMEGLVHVGRRGIDFGQLG